VAKRLPSHSYRTIPNVCCAASVVKSVSSIEKTRRTAFGISVSFCSHAGDRSPPDISLSDGAWQASAPSLSLSLAATIMLGTWIADQSITLHGNLYVSAYKIKRLSSGWSQPYLAPSAHHRTSCWAALTIEDRSPNV
jgi:hypothetical protein